MSVTDSRAFDEALQQLRAEQPHLAPYLKVPPPERPVVTRARMAKAMQERMAATGSVTYEDLEGAGFTPREISEHFHQAKRIAGLTKMVA